MCEVFFVVCSYGLMSFPIYWASFSRNVCATKRECVCELLYICEAEHHVLEKAG